MSSDMPVEGELGERPFELLPREIKSVVVDALARILESLQQQVHLAEIPGTLKSVPGFWRWLQEEAHPLPSSITMAPEGMDLAISVAHDVSTLIS